MSLLMVAQERSSYDRWAKKISEHKNYQAHKEAINILEIAKEGALKSRAVDGKKVCSLCAFTYCQT